MAFLAACIFRRWPGRPADTAAVRAINTIAPPQPHFATVRMAREYLRPVRQGVITARSRVTVIQDRTLECRARVCDGQERVVLDFRARFKIARGARIRNVTFGDVPIQSAP